MASRAAWYCRGVKINVTFSFTPAAAKGSKASSPAGVAGTLIKRFLWPADQRRANSIYRATRCRCGRFDSGSSNSGSTSKLT